MPDRFFALSVDLLCVVGFDGHFLLTNPAWEATLGYSGAELAGRVLLDFVHPDDREETRAKTDRIIAGEPGRPFENRFLHKDGTFRQFRWSLSAIPQKRQFYAVAHDITDIRDAHEDRRQSDARLMEARKWESLSLLAGAVAHEFNNILQVILGNAEAALALIESDSPLARRVELISKAGQRATHLTRQMLACAGRGQPSFQCSDISQLVEGSAAALQSQLPAGVELRLALARNLPAVVLDAAQIRQVLVGLVRNAGEAIRAPTGTVTVRTGLVDYSDAEVEGALALGHVRTLKYIVAEVSDDGCGMDVGTRSRMFEPFFSTKFLGRGLGLASALGIVRAHGGIMKVTSEPGEGTALRILLPALDGEPLDVSGEGSRTLTRLHPYVSELASRPVAETVPLAGVEAESVTPSSPRRADCPGEAPGARPVRRGSGPRARQRPARSGRRRET